MYTKSFYIWLHVVQEAINKSEILTIAMGQMPYVYLKQKNRLCKTSRQRIGRRCWPINLVQSERSE